MRTCTNGFTLIELMVTLSILATLITIGMPSFSELLRNNAITAAGNDLYASLQFARSEAVSREVVVRVQASGAQWSDGWNVFYKDDKGDDQILDVYRSMNKRIEISPKGNRLDAANSVRFTPTGRAVLAYDESQDYFEVRLPTVRTRCVFMSATGRPFVKKSGEGDCP